LKENIREKTFDTYRQSWEYLQDKPKFSVTCTQLTRKKEVIMIDDNDNNKDDSEVKEKLQPMGRNCMKRKLVEEKILVSV
jgi:hypothetical protein